MKILKSSISLAMLLGACNINAYLLDDIATFKIGDCSAESPSTCGDELCIKREMTAVMDP